MEVEASKQQAGSVVSAAGCKPENFAWAAAEHQAARLTLLWEFDELSGGRFVNFPATDHPYADGYQNYCAQQGAAK